MIKEHKKVLLALVLSLLVPFHLYGENLNRQNTSVPDTVYFALKSNMIKEAKMEEIKWIHTTRYRIVVQLKEQYHKQFEVATEKSIGKYMAITYEGIILSPNLPTINTKFENGRFVIGPFEWRSVALTALNMILGKN